MTGYLSQLQDRPAWLARRWEKAARIVAVLREEGGAKARVLDVGCSVGTTLSLLLKEGATPVGIDMDREALRQAREETGGRAHLVLASGDALPFKAASFQGLIANHVLEYVPDQRRAVAEWGRVLETDAPIYLAAVNSLKFAPAWPFRGETRRRVLRRIHHGEDAIGRPRTWWGLRSLFSGWGLADRSRHVLAHRERYGSSEAGRWVKWIPRFLWQALLFAAPSWILVGRAPSRR